MAETAKNATSKKKTEIIRISIDRNPNAPQSMFVSHNFKDYLIPRGKDVEVPCEVAEIVREQRRAEEAAYVYATTTAAIKQPG